MILQGNVACRGLGLFSVLSLGLCLSCDRALAQNDLVARVAAAATLEVEQVCAPMRTTKHYRPQLIPNPDGKTYDVLIRYFETYWGPHTMHMIDLGTGKIYRHTIPEGLPDQHRFRIGPDGRFYQHWSIPGEEGQSLAAYDPGTNTFDIVARSVPVGGEVQPIVIGTDGFLYGAGSRDHKACAYQFDTQTGKLKDFGTMGPSHAPNACWGYSVGADDDYVYMASGKIPWYLVALNKKTGKDTVLLTMDDPRGHVSVSQERYGCSASSRGHDKTERYWLYKGQSMPKETGKPPPWPEPETPQPWVVKPPAPELGIGKLTPKADGWCELWYKQPDEDHWRAVGFEVPTFPVPIYRVTALADGRVCGSGGNYLGNFLYDPGGNESVHPGLIKLSHYCSTVSDGKVYMSGYPSSALYVWDPNLPWTANKSPNPWSDPIAENNVESNPRRLCYLASHGAGTHKMWTATTAADGTVYFGGRWYRNGEGGGLGWWNPRTGKANGLADPFVTFQIAYMTTAVDGRYVIISTICARDQTGKHPTPKDAKVFVFDTTTEKLVRDFVPVPAATRSGAIAGVGGPFVLGLTFDPDDRPDELKPEEQDEYLKEKTLIYGLRDRHSVLYKANVETGEVLWRKKLPYPVGFRTNENFAHQDGFDFKLGPDGMVWTFTGARFNLVNPEKRWHYAYTNCAIVEDPKLPDGFRLDNMNCVLIRIDPVDGTVHVVGKLTHTGEMAFVGRDLYLAGGDKYLVQHNSNLRRIRGIVPGQ